MNHKATRLFTFLATFLFLDVMAPIALAIGPELGQWKAIMNGRDKGIVFDALNASTPAWPKVHSSEFSGRLKDTDRQEQAEFLSMAHDIVHDAKAFLDETPGHTSVENWRRLDSALRLRDSMLHNPGYVNMVLADGLNRLSFVSLCKELGAEKQVSPELEKALSRLMTYKVTLDQWVNVTKEEMELSDEKLKEVADAPDVEAGLNKLWDLLTDRDNFMCPANLLNFCTDDLLRKRDISMLLNRYIHTDFEIKTLSLAVQYKKQATNFSLDDGGEKIEKVLPSLKEGDKISIVATGGAPRVVMTKLPVNKTNLSVGERFLNTRSSAYEVANLLHMIKSGGIGKFMPFYRADILTDRGHP